MNTHYVAKIESGHMYIMPLDTAVRVASDNDAFLDRLFASQIEGSEWIKKALPPTHEGLLHRELDVPEGEKIPEDKMDKALHSDDPKEKKRAEFAEELEGFHHKGAWSVVADTDKDDDKNTDLGGPEPKIDKEKQTDTNPPKDVLGDEDKGRWPTKRKDVTEVIVRENREVGGHPNHVVKEIGENTTTHYDLPAAKGDQAGFDPGGVTHEDGPFTFDNKGQQQTAVTRETQK